MRATIGSGKGKHMREVFSDFFRRETLPDGRVRIPLGAEQDVPDLRGLHDGEEVRLVLPGELTAQGLVESVTQGGYTLWYAVLASMGAIQPLEPTPDGASSTSPIEPASTPSLR